ncbi:putative choline kinase [Sesamum angolense]|uniref:Choline kinase n=1 Tax=Sesamum angolense TaxID=2727404 RepID=A0AAE1WUF5_9LAMI|nr:putative choline kinase [Sesamum angolense]
MRYHATRTCCNGFPVKHRHLATALCAIPKARLSFASLDCRKYRVNSAIQIPPIFHSLLSLAQIPWSCEIKQGISHPGGSEEDSESLAAEWTDISDADALQVIPLKGAMTNEVYQIKWRTNSTRHASRKVLVRIYGSGVEVFFNRENEIRTFEFMSKQGQGPLLLGRFPNGRVEEFIRARTLTAGDLRDPEISALIATKMKEFHSLDMPGPKTVALWDRLRKWLNEAKRLSSPPEAEEFRLKIFEDEISELEKNLSTGHQLVGFCHNDLQYVVDECSCSFSSVIFTILTAFSLIMNMQATIMWPLILQIIFAMAADYHTETPHVLDYSKYPGLEERQRFLSIYLSGSGNQPSDLELGQLLEQVQKYTLASHLLWGLWGIISVHL